MPAQAAISAAARSFDAIVLGAEPAGATTSLLLREPALKGIEGAPLRVLLVDARPQDGARWTNVALLQPTVVDDLHRFGIHDDVLPAARDEIVGADGHVFGVASIARLEQALRRRAIGAGAEAAWSSTIDGVRTLPDGSIEAMLHGADGTTQAVRAAALVDATGGRSGLLDRTPIGDAKQFITGWLPHDPAVPTHHAAGEDVHDTQVTTMSYNHSRDGMATFALGSPASAAADAATRTRMLADALSTSGLRPEGSDALVGALRGVQHVEVQSSLAEVGARDGIYGVGETIGTGDPRHGDGVDLAFEDATTLAGALQAVARPPLPAGATDAELAAHRADVERLYSRLVVANHRYSAHT